MGLREALAAGMESPLKLFLRRSAVVALIRVGGLLCVFGLQILLARLIGSSEEYGKYAWGQSLLFMTGTLAAMGLPIATSRFIASLNAQDNEHAVVAVIHQARKLLSRSSGVLVLLALGLVVISSTIIDPSYYLDLSALALLFAPGVSLLLLYQHMARARQWLILAFLPMQVLRPLATAILAVIAWWLLGDSLSGILTLVLVGLSIFATDLLQTAIYHSRQKKLLSAVQGIAASSTEYHPVELSRTAFPIFITRIATLSIEYSNVLLVGFLAGPAQAGAYFAADRLAQLCSIPSSIMSSVSQPEMAAANARDNRQLLHSITRRAVHGGLWPTVAIGLVSMALADQLLALFGDDFAAAAPVLVILVLGLIAKAAIGPANDLLLMTGNQQLLPRVMIVTAVFHLVTLGLVVPEYGAIGAAATSALSGLLSSAWLTWFVKQQLSINSTITARGN